MKKIKIATALAAMALSVGAAGTARAVVIVDDRFNDGGYTNGTDLLDAAWTKVAADNGLISVGSGELLFDNARSNNAGAYPVAKGTFSGTSIALGDSLILSFDLRITATTPLSTSGTNGASNSAAFRMGLGSSTESFLASFGSGVAAGGSIYKYGADIASGTSVNLTTAGGGTVALNDNNTHLFTLVASRTASDTLAFTATVDSTSWSGRRTGVSNFSFDRIILAEGNVNNLDMAFDNFSVEHVIPEPAGMAILGVAGMAALSRRRRA